jgi:hypothetical protein
MYFFLTSFLSTGKLALFVAINMRKTRSRDRNYSNQQYQQHPLLIINISAKFQPY